jgi:citrate lyase subunit beta/citryl-CoA lyase
VSRARRSWLYAPASEPRRLAKALTCGADVVVADLEDAVPAGQKEDARRVVTELVAVPLTTPLWVRVNHPRSPWGRDDVLACTGPGVAGLRLPKCEDPEDVRRVAGWLEQSGRPVPLSLLLETALGVERAYELVTCSPLVAGVGLGEADLRADLRVSDDAALGWARGRVVTAARAAGLPGPVQSVHTRLRDPDGLRATSVAGRALGCSGRSVIHPEQVPVVNEVYAPSLREVAAARALLDGLEKADAAGTSAFVAADGRFVDPAVVASAHWTLSLVESPEEKS